MAEKIDQQLVENVMFEKIRDVDRYYQSIQYILGLKFYLEKHKELKAKFIGAEVVLTRTNLEKVNPDVCVQVTKDSLGEIGLPIEIKSSLSTDKDVFSKLKKMERYNDGLKGWETSSGKIDEEAIVFSPYVEDVGRALKVLNNSISNKALVFKKELLIWQWSLVQSLKDPNRENLLVQQIYGSLSKRSSSFNEVICDGIKQDINEISLIIEKERNLFTNQKPPVEYTMLMLWQNVFGRVLNENNNIISKEKVTEIVNKYYTDSIMKNPQNKEYKFKVAWAEEALKMFKNIGLAENIGSEYSIKLNCNKKDIKKHFCTKAAIYEIKKGVHSDKLKDSKNAPLASFKSKNKKLFQNENK